MHEVRGHVPRAGLSQESLGAEACLPSSRNINAGQCSDARLKHDIIKVEPSTIYEVFNKINVRTYIYIYIYIYISGDIDSTQRRIGFISQDFHEALPDDFNCMANYITNHQSGAENMH